MEPGVGNPLSYTRMNVFVTVSLPRQGSQYALRHCNKTKHSFYAFKNLFLKRKNWRGSFVAQLANLSSANLIVLLFVSTLYCTSSPSS